jgi:polyphosphate kinase
MNNPKSPNNRLFNREESWLQFNQRVLGEALDESTALLERVKFLAITAANLDEFFMVRVGGLSIRFAQGNLKPDACQLTPHQQLELISEQTHEMLATQYTCFNDSLCPLLENEGIKRLTIDDVSQKQHQRLSDLFNQELFSVISPLSISSDGNLPLIGNQQLHLALRIRQDNEQHPFRTAILPIGGPTPRFITISAEERHAFILVEDVVAAFCQNYFPHEEVVDYAAFRITRNADMRVQEEVAADLMEEMGHVLDERKVSECVRLEVAASCSPELLKSLQQLFAVPSGFTYSCDGPLDLKAWFQIAEMRGFEKLQIAPWPAVTPPQIDPRVNIFDQIKQNDIILHHPFHSFDSVIAFIETAATDPHVLAIKQTLYRTSRQSPIIDALVAAAENGKSVTVIIELKARFDEARNIVGAQRLEQAGVHVIYGVRGFKTHAKTLIVIRREPQGICRYIHFGTGNYNEATARLYTDISLFTCDPVLGNDAIAFFNAVTGRTQPQRLDSLCMAPLGMRQRILDLIAFETQQAAQGKKSGITAKLNSLVDPQIIKALYKASQAGVKIELNVRGVCCLQPKVAGQSENIRVISIIDRLLEHSRIMHFIHAGEQRVFISSADWMPRNLDRRVELLVPVHSQSCKEFLLDSLRSNMADNQNSHELQSAGNYKRISAEGVPPHRSQQFLYLQACDSAKQAQQTQSASFVPHQRMKT